MSRTHRSPGRSQGLSGHFWWGCTALLALVLTIVVVVTDTRDASSSSAASTRTAAAQRTTARPVHGAVPRPVEQPAAAGSATESTTGSTTGAADRAACTGRPAGRSVLVSISRQHAWMCNGQRLVRSTPVTTGADRPDRRTHVGTWAIVGKQTQRWLGGPGYSVKVHYWLPYDGDFGIHDATWQKMAFGSPGWRTFGSHGCVHFPLAQMAWLYGWVSVGTPVTVEH